MAQLDLFGRGRVGPLPSQAPDIERIRIVLTTAIRELAEANEMPWEPNALRSWRHVFQNMTKWLSAEEGQKLRREFETQIARLQQTLPI
jgi:hypothetical protein